jgi:hypothetical protein
LPEKHCFQSAIDCFIMNFDTGVKIGAPAVGIKLAGVRIPNFGCRTLRSASTPQIAKVLKSTFGWYQSSDHPCTNACSRSTFGVSDISFDASFGSSAEVWRHALNSAI